VSDSPKSVISLFFILSIRFCLIVEIASISRKHDADRADASVPRFLVFGSRWHRPRTGKVASEISGWFVESRQVHL
jgi:hypothetical protein